MNTTSKTSSRRPGTPAPNIRLTSTTEQLAVFDEAMRRASSDAGALMRRAEFPARQDTGAPILLRVRRRRVEAHHLTADTVTVMTDTDLADLIDDNGRVATSGAVVFATPACLNKVRAHVRDRALACSASGDDHGAGKKLWTLHRMLGWLFDSAPPVTFHLVVLTRCLREMFWCADPTVDTLEPWAEAANLGDVDHVGQVAGLYELLPSDPPLTYQAVKKTQPGGADRRTWVSWLTTQIRDTEATALQGCAGFRQSGEARVFSAGEALVELWEAQYGIDQTLHARNLIQGAVADTEPGSRVDVVQEAPDGKGFYVDVVVEGCVAARVGTTLLVTLRGGAFGTAGYTFSGEFIGATAEVDGVQTVTVTAGPQTVSLLRRQQPGSATVSVGPSSFYRSHYVNRSEWFNNAWKKLPAIRRDVPVDVLLAGGI